MFRLTMINVKNKSPFMFRFSKIQVKKKSPIQSMDVRHEDVLIVASLILVDREAEADGHQLVPGEAAGSRVAQHRAGVLVGVLPAQFLQQDVALLHLSRPSSVFQPLRAKCHCRANRSGLRGYKRTCCVSTSSTISSEHDPQSALKRLIVRPFCSNLKEPLQRVLLMKTNICVAIAILNAND